MRHLVCWPYSIQNLHDMAAKFRLHRCWFHASKPRTLGSSSENRLAHYDIPKRRMAEIAAQTEVVSARIILAICKGEAPPMKFVVHCKREFHDVYIGRPSKWGNPFSHLPNTRAQFHVATRDEAIAAYERWILTQPDLIAALPELRGAVLGCWCDPLPCHGHVLARLANR
jgi:hypothetical protein